MKKTALEKQIKRRITAREHKFFAVCPPGLTQFCRSEIMASKIAEDRVDLTTGGIEFVCKPDMCMELNLRLGSPSRILMRVSDFRATTFQEFGKKMAALPWQLYLPHGCRPDIHVSTKKSVLYHSDAVALRCDKILLNQLGPADPNSGADSFCQSLFVRGFKDRFTLSLDCSGEPLYKRGIKKSVTPAPLRETLAFAILNWSGFKKEDVLLDPMCGSGTFSLEAALIKKNIPPGFFRSFAFQSWPGFSTKTIAWLKKKAKENFNPNPVSKIFAFDVNDNAINSISNNCSNPYLKDTIHIEKKNFFDLDPARIKTNSKGVILLNPPYGKRLDKGLDTKTFYREIGKKLIQDFKGWRTGIIFPDNNTYHASGLSLNQRPLYHGGLDLITGIGKI